LIDTHDFFGGICLEEAVIVVVHFMTHRAQREAFILAFGRDVRRDDGSNVVDRENKGFEVSSPTRRSGSFSRIEVDRHSDRACSVCLGIERRSKECTCRKRWLWSKNSIKASCEQCSESNSRFLGWRYQANALIYPVWLSLYFWQVAV
jgi:hypothetical protein